MTADEESTLKRHARRRLIGAVALATFVVVTLPLVFDAQPPATLDNDIRIQIAGQPFLVPSNPVEDTPASSPVVAAGVAGSAPLATAASAVIEAQPQSAVPAASAVAVPLTLSQSMTVPAAEKNDSEPDGNKPKVDKPKSDTSPKEPAKSERAVPHSGYVIQIGAYSNPASARNMEAKLTKLGFHTYTEKVSGNVRVRVGSYSSREAADKARQKLLAQGLHPNIVHLD